MKLVSFFTGVFLQLHCIAGELPNEVKSNCLSIHNTWLQEMYDLTRNCVGFSAPVSGRAYNYVAIGMYESNVELLNEMQSLTGQLEGYDRQTWKEDSQELNWKVVSNTVDYELVRYFYRNMPPSNRKHVEFLVDSIEHVVSKKYAKKVNVNSRSYGVNLANEIISWSKLDGGDHGFENNFPNDFEIINCPSCWVKTAPGYLSALLPYWGENQLLLHDSHTQVENCTVYPYSEDSTSVLYKEAMKVISNAKKTADEYELIAEYWDDGAGYSGTPTGHFFSIAKSLVTEKNVELSTALELYVKLGLAVNEAFILAFRLKYKYNFIRPITYIHRNIDAQFNTRIASPPFPEFPSGHSFQSGAATEVMQSIFSDTVSITDSTNFHRSDIDGTPRTFNSFTEMSEEISISRFYGGIHFLKTLDESLVYGRKIGRFVVGKVKCRK